MKVFFLKNVTNIGKKGDIKEVKPGFAYHMLFPQKLALPFNPAQEKQYIQEQNKKEIQRRELLENKYNIVEKLHGKSMEFHVKTGNNGKIFGGIGEKDILAYIKKEFHITLSKKHIHFFEGHIKKIGEHQVSIQLGKDAIAKMQILVNKA